MKGAVGPPLIALALTLLAYLALFLTAGTLPMLFVFTAAVLGSYFVRARLPEGPLVLISALVLLVATYYLTGEPTGDSALLFGSAFIRNMMGQAAALGLVLQYWTYRPNDPARTLLYICLFGALTILAACNTYDDRFSRFYCPSFVLLATLTLRATRPRRGASRRVSLPLVAALLTAGLIGLGTAQFVIVYKTPITEWGNRLSNDRPYTEMLGLSDQPMLGSTFNQRNSARRVLRVENYRNDGHLRGMAFSAYVKGRWLPPVSQRPLVSFSSEEDSLKVVGGRRGSQSHVERLALDNPILYAPLSARRFEMDSDSRTEWDASDGGPLLVHRGGASGYSFWALGDEGQGIFAQPPGPELREALTMLDAGMAEALRPYALRAIGEARNDQEKADRIASYLMQKHPYSLSYRAGGGDPVINFVRREGVGAHCEYFASAATLMLRSLGVPARYVVGYYAHERDENDQIIVRQHDAHAWCEAWIDGHGWVVVEATPPSGMPDQQEDGVELWRWTWERLQDTWERLRDMVVELRMEGVFALSLVLLGAAGLINQIRRRRLREPDAPGYPTPAQMAILAARFERALAAQGVQTPPNTPWSERLAMLPDSDADLRARGETFAVLYDAARFGAGADSPSLEAALKAVETLPRRKPPAAPR